MNNLEKRLDRLEILVDARQPKKELFEKYGLKDQHECDTVLTAYVHALETFYGDHFDFREYMQERSAGKLWTDEETALFYAVLEQFKAGKLIRSKNGRYQLTTKTETTGEACVGNCENIY